MPPSPGTNADPDLLRKIVPLKRLRTSAAEAILSAAVRCFPDNIKIAIQHARVASTRLDWPEALRRWDALAQRVPTDQYVINQRLHVDMVMRLMAIDHADDGSAPPAVQPSALRAELPGEADACPGSSPPGVATALPDLFLQFESMGHNCEFGLVQRHFGAEPLGLLRWNAISVEDVILGIEQQFEGVGNPERHPTQRRA